MTMDVKNVVLAKLADHVPGQLNCSDIDVDSTLKELMLDSLAVVQIVFELEERFSVIIEESELSQIETIADIISAVDKAQTNVA